MAWFIVQSAVMIVLAFLLGLLVGWIIWHRRSEVNSGNGSAAGTGGDAAEPAGTTDHDVAAEALPADEDASVAAGMVAAAVAEPLAATAEAVPRPRQADATETDTTETEAPAAEPAVAGPTAIEPVATTAPTKPAKAPKAPKTGKQPAPAKVDAVAVVPTPVHDEPELEPIDDLACIEGIGPKIAGALVEAGIRSYEQLAAADTDTLRTAINKAGIKFAPSITTWSRQARLLADGDETGFEALVAHLIAGREPGAPGEPAAESAASAADEPVAADVPIDDLARIEGIGPKIASALVDAGIRSYGQLANADEETLRSAINTAGIKFAPSITTWSQQARLLADGDEAGFTDLTLRLVAGREKPEGVQA